MEEYMAAYGSQANDKSAELCQRSYILPICLLFVGANDFVQRDILVSEAGLGIALPGPTFAGRFERKCLLRAVMHAGEAEFAFSCILQPVRSERKILVRAHIGTHKALHTAVFSQLQ